MQTCNVCRDETNYPNGLCAFCHNLGLVGVCEEGLIINPARFKEYAMRTPLGLGLTAHIERIADMQKALYQPIGTLLSDLFREHYRDTQTRTMSLERVYQQISLCTHLPVTQGFKDIVDQHLEVGPYWVNGETVERRVTR